MLSRFNPECACALDCFRYKESAFLLLKDGREDSPCEMTARYAFSFAQKQRERACSPSRVFIDQPGRSTELSALQ